MYIHRIEPSAGHQRRSEPGLEPIRYFTLVPQAVIPISSERADNKSDIEQRRSFCPLLAEYLALHIPLLIYMGVLLFSP
jgi:hypothetical protein